MKTNETSLLQIGTYDPRVRGSKVKVTRCRS